MVLAVFQNTNYLYWQLIVQFGIVSLMLLIANIVRRKVKLFRNLLFPTAIIAGFIGLGVKYLIFGLDIQIDGQLILTNDFLEAVTYHAIALGFIAMGLKSVKKEDTKKVNGKPFKTGLVIVNTYLLQGIVGVAITIILSYLFVEIAPYAGLLLPMGYGQGPGQAANIGALFEENGFVGGKTFGLSIATFGILWACVAGIFYINKRAKEGKIQRANEEVAQAVSTEEVETKEEIPVSEAIDKMSIQIILISITYGLSYLFMRGITKLINIDAVTGLVWGFNFIFGMLFAILIKQIMNWLRKIKLIKRKYTNEYMLNRITGVVFDYMIVASIMSINIEMLVNTGLWIGLLVITTIGGIVTYSYLRYTIKRVYPEYEHQAFAALFGNLAGTASNGIALLREIDPDFKTPAADDLVTGSSTAVLFGAPLLAITALIYQPKWYYLWGCWVVMIIFFVLFSYFLLKKPSKQKNSE
ncbi:MAG TPA: sodium:glutamate symporter [Bacilli bacterium]|jgi:ESS family glutamate:Na+ symporter|nr:sodium:glutamate symporter [Acholeplasmataceae bacterium]HNZ78020.1 sodium:glutamate symporter [Bacilli bacterium]HOD61181.1 sodium:glutamate symporter [Bacilli bacterium]HOE07124.1 sodium:glutamate symporter [Bacilli bacterium]HOH62356.1 sodium:glutamate symporter [Bacilli bacterium]